MERRGFLKGLFGAPMAVAAGVVVAKEAPAPQVIEREVVKEVVVEKEANYIAQFRQALREETGITSEEWASARRRNGTRNWALDMARAKGKVIE